MRNFWGSLSKTERRLGLLSWLLSLLTLIWWGLIVSNEYWENHAFLLNLASATTGALFGVPIAVIAFSRFGEHVATRSAASEAARLALGDAFTVRDFLAQRSPPDGTQARLRKAQDDLASIPPDDSERLNDLIQRVSQDGVDLESNVVSVIRIDRVARANGGLYIDKLRRSMLRLADFERTRFLAPRAEELQSAWASLSNPPRISVSPAGGESVPDGRNRALPTLHAAVECRIKESMRLIKDADAIDSVCERVIFEIRGEWPHLYDRLRPTKAPEKPRPSGSLTSRA